MEKNIYSEVCKTIEEANNLAAVNPDKAFTLGEKAYLLSVEKEKSFSIISKAFILSHPFIFIYIIIPFYVFFYK